VAEICRLEAPDMSLNIWGKHQFDAMLQQVRFGIYTHPGIYIYICDYIYIYICDYIYM